jgi:hypothetical protein
MKRYDTFMESSDRYVFDFRICTTARGWAQIDTKSDASYYGHWVNPFKLEIMSYVEGDVSRFVFDSAEELVQHMAEMNQWHAQNDNYGIKLDPGFNAELNDRLIEIGLAEYVH